MGFVNVSVEDIFAQFLLKVAVCLPEEKRMLGLWWAYLFFISYFVAPRATLGHWWGGSLTHLVLITTSFLVRPEFHQEPRNDMSNDIFREVFMIGGKPYVGATFNKNKLNVICNIFNLIKYFSWKPKFWCAKYRCTIMKVDLKYYFV